MKTGTKKAGQVSQFLAIVLMAYSLVTATASVTRFLTLREFRLVDEIEADRKIVVLAMHSVVAGSLAAAFAGLTLFFVSRHSAESRTHTHNAE